MDHQHNRTSSSRYYYLLCVRVSADIIILLLFLTVVLDVYPKNQHIIATFDNATEVSMSCEMSLYLHPDENLQWYRGGEVIAADTERHTITYTNGTALGQFGDDFVGPSRVSTLVISQPQMSDSDTYTCAIINTQHSQDIQLIVESVGMYVAICISSINNNFTCIQVAHQKSLLLLQHLQMNQCSSYTSVVEQHWLY